MAFAVSAAIPGDDGQFSHGHVLQDCQVIAKSVSGMSDRRKDDRFFNGLDEENRTSGNVRNVRLEEDMIDFQRLGAKETGRPIVSDMSD
jgi:hypothetical protein